MTLRLHFSIWEGEIMVVLVATSHQEIKSSFLFGRLEASSAVAPTRTELVLC